MPLRWIGERNRRLTHQPSSTSVLRSGAFLVRLSHRKHQKSTSSRTPTTAFLYTYQWGLLCCYPCISWVRMPRSTPAVRWYTSRATGKGVQLGWVCLPFVDAPRCPNSPFSKFYSIGHCRSYSTGSWRGMLKVVDPTVQAACSFSTLTYYEILGIEKLVRLATF